MLNSISSNYLNSLDADIGGSQLGVMNPTAGMVGTGYIPGVTGTMDGISINGQLPYDTVNISGSNRRKTFGPVTTFVIGALGLVTVGFLLKKGKDGVVDGWKKLMTKLGFNKKKK